MTQMVEILSHVVVSHELPEIPEIPKIPEIPEIPEIPKEGEYFIFKLLDKYPKESISAPVLTAWSAVEFRIFYKGDPGFYSPPRPKNVTHNKKSCRSRDQ